MAQVTAVRVVGDLVLSSSEAASVEATTQPEGGIGGEPPSPPPSNTVTVKVPVLTTEIRLAQYTPETFGPSQQALYISNIEAGCQSEPARSGCTLA